MKSELTLQLLPGREKLARNRHPWVFSGALESSSKNLLKNWSPRGPWKDQPALLEDHRGQFVAYGWVNPDSKICLRLVSWDRSVFPDDAWLLAQFRKSFELRRDLGLLGTTDTLAGRIVFSEGDGIPGVIVDHFAGYLVCQFENQGADARRKPIVDALTQTALEFLPSLKGIMEYSTGDGRVLEGLEPRSGLLWGENPPEELEIQESGVSFWVHLGEDSQKTGFYTDQRENRRRIATYAPGRSVLDVCSFSGAFGTSSLAVGARSCTFVDMSQDALELAKQNSAPWAQICSYKKADAFSYLRGLQAESQEMIIFDPPKLIPSRKTKPRGLRAYKDANLHALWALEPGGYLATFSCSGLLTREEFVEMFQFAAKDAGRDVQILEHLSQAPCHPVRTAFPEGSYLKGLIARVL